MGAQPTSAGRRSLAGRVRAILARRELLLAFTAREIQVRYKQAFLGMAWAVFMPFALMLVWTAARRQLLGAGDVGGVNPAVWAYCGLLVWTLHLTALKGCTNTLVTNKNLLSKVYFPREIFPLSKIGAALVDFAVGLLALVALMAWAGTPFHAGMALLPLAVALHVLLLVGFGFLLSALNLFFRDVQYVFDVFMMVWMFASPVFVETEGAVVVGGFDVLRYGNPMHPVVTLYRDVLLHGGVRDPGHLLVGVAWAAGAFLAGFLLFARAEPKFAERA